MSNALHKLILDVADVDRSLNFYAGLLNLRLRQDTRLDGVRLATLSAGGLQVMLVQRPIEDIPAPAFRSSGVVMNFEIDDLAGIAPSLRDSGATVMRGLERSVSGEASVLVADPDGYAVLLSESRGGERVH